MNTRTSLGLLIGLLAITAVSFAIQVDGYCYLENQQNHAGTKVLFRADSPTAVTDSVYTDNLGYYQLDAAIGIYDIFYTHEGFGGEIVYNQLLVTPTTLPEVTLSAIPDGIHISGSLSGILADTVYVVEDDIWIENDFALTIEAGSAFYFLGDEINSYRFEIYGQLICHGTETDSIKFLPAGNSPGWGGIHFSNAEYGRLEYCVISGCNDYSALYLHGEYYDSLIVRHCAIVGNQENGIECGEGEILLEYCMIGNNSGYGIQCYIYSRPIIRNCSITGNGDWGIYCYDARYLLTVDHCTITLNDGDGIFFDYAEGTVSNCTISRNGGPGIRCGVNNRAVILNTTIEGNTDAGILFDDSENTSVTYCDFYNNAGGNFTGSVIPQALGEIVTINANGDSCDVYANLYLDPRFVNPSIGDYHLQAASPCIDAGDPDSPLDPDGTVADIGAFYFNQLWVNDDPKLLQPSEIRLFPNYPNPFNAATVIEYSLPQAGRISLIVYNIIGQKVATLVDGYQDAGYHSVNWNAASLASGVYIYQLQVSSHTLTQKMVLLR